METILVERDAGVVTVTLNRPEKRNAINTQMWLELRDALREIEANRDDRVLVVTGAGTRSAPAPTSPIPTRNSSRACRSCGASDRWRSRCTT